MGKLFKRKEPDSEEGTSNISPDNEESKGQLKKAKKDSSAVDARAPSLTVAEAGQQKVQKLKENGGAPSLRRSSRNLNAIRLRGTAQTFYHRLRSLFFSPPSHKGYQSIGGNRIKLKRVYKYPPIYVIDDFLTSADLEYFEAKIDSCPFERSFVDNMEHDELKENLDSEKVKRKQQRRTLLDTSHRTSSFYGFKKLHDNKIAALEQRTADLLGCWVHQIESLQLVRYLPGQFFGVHHDMGDLLEDDQVILPRKQLAVKRRLVTLFCYLNSLDTKQGGCTYFPKCGNLRIRPKKGRAVLWSNVTSDGLPEPKTIHAGEAVQLSGKKDVVKYGLNVWICEE